MPRQNQTVENILLLEGGCSSSPTSSSVLREGYRFKKAIVVAKRGGGFTTPVPTWRLMGRSPSPSLRAAASSPCGCKVPVSARKLAATLWEMKEKPSPRVVEEENMMKVSRKSRKERIAPPLPPLRSARSGSLPAHLSDPSHSPVSERMDRSGTGSRQRTEASAAQKLRLGDYNVGANDHISNGSFMHIENRSRTETLTMGVKTRLKECSNALTTSKELLKIINRMWGQEEDRPSSSISLVSALHSELERARLLINQLIHEHKPENNDINYLMKRFAEEKAAWKSNEQEVVEAAIESVAGELEVERKLRRRFEGLNKRLGKELADAKAALMKEVEDETEEDDLHSIELNVDKSYKWPYGEENKRGRKSTSSQSFSLQRSVSDWVVQSEKLQKSGGLEWGRPIEGYLDETQACKPNKASSKDHHLLLSGPRLSNFRGGPYSLVNIRPTI